MALHFSAEEFAARKAGVLAAMAARGLDGLLLFDPASHYWLTGYDTFGYCFFQCLVVGGDGDLALLTRSADLRQARHTSLIEDVRVWVDRAGANPADGLRDLLRDQGLAGKRLGAEFQSHGLTHANGRMLEAVLTGFSALEDASDLVPPLRLIKSPAEIACIRRAAALADAALDAGVQEARPGADEGRILAAMQGAVFAGGGDYPGNPFIIGSGRDALLCRTKSGRRQLDPDDQLTLEFAGVFRHYHVCLMRTLVVGAPTDRQYAMFEATREALLAAEAELRPGQTMGEVYAAQARVLDTHGMAAHRLNACGYSLGAVFAPSWMDWPMFYAGNPITIASGMVFFLHMILMDSHSATAMTLGRTSLVTETGAASLSQAQLSLELA